MLVRLLGLDPRPVSWTERLLATVGGFVAIYAIQLVSQATLGEAALPIIASMGASAVLLFAVPHGPLSQPWPVAGGHVSSAVVGVSCATLLGDGPIPAATAVGLAIGLMHLLRCLHPPGGATALFAVLGGPAIHGLGYDFVVAPVLVNVGVILTVAAIFNAPFAWRRYPASLAVPAARREHDDRPQAPGVLDEDLAFALSEVGTYIDISEEDLQQIYEIANRHASDRHDQLFDRIEIGHCYSNARFGAEWEVREVVRIKPVGDGDRHVLDYRVVAGRRRNTNGKSSLPAFLRWTKSRVERRENDWVKIEPRA